MRLKHAICMMTILMAGSGSGWRRIADGGGFAVSGFSHFPIKVSPVAAYRYVTVSVFPNSSQQHRKIGGNA